MLPKFAPEKRHIVGQYMHIQGYRDLMPSKLAPQ